jgi:hypothetical protein
MYYKSHGLIKKQKSFSLEDYKIIIYVGTKSVSECYA